MLSLIGLVKPLIHIMILAILLGVAGFLCAIFLTIFAGQGFLHYLHLQNPNLQLMAKPVLNAILPGLVYILILLAVLRGLFHYAEQYCNHFIAFKLLAIIRHKVFAALRTLCPAKLEVRDKGNLVSLITTDIELLEVFYAHTLSPIAIAFFTCLIMLIFIGHYHIVAAAFALCAYLTVGVVIPLANGKRGGEKGMAFRSRFGELNSFVLESLRGLRETIQYDDGENRKNQMKVRSEELIQIQNQLNRLEADQRSKTHLIVLLFSLGMLFLCLALYRRGLVGFDGVLIPTIAMMSSFGPVVALSALSNTLNQTLASGERVLSLLQEKPMVEEVDDEHSSWNGSEHFTGATVNQVNFSYDHEEILKDYSMDIRPNRIIGIHGVSGSGKSTLLKLLMRFWDVQQGTIQIAGENIQNIPTKKLRDTESYVTQETHLFKDTIGNNIAIAKPEATDKEIIEAAKKASLHDFISQLPKAYDTPVGELGESLSGGEAQRIGIARAFLHDAPFILLDEPTSNLDSLNEGIILKSVKEACAKKTVLLISHRKSTMTVADEVYTMDQGRIS